ncbi:MAG: LacI family DNA-binding transcriptional regulator [Protaetiibacter sp.]
MARSGGPTLSDVAEQAQVSLATASKALNGVPGVRDATRTRVLDAAKELGFAPNLVARNLARNRSETIGLLTSDMAGRFVLPILMGAEDAFGIDEFSVILSDARGDAIREQHHVQLLLSRRVDAFMVVGHDNDPRPPIELPAQVPIIYVYAPSTSAGHLSITPDNRQGAGLAVDHLLGIGRRRIAHVTGDPGSTAARERREGIEAALGAHGLVAAFETRFGDWTERWGRAAAGLLLEGDPEVDGVVCDSDVIARGVLEGLQAQGRSIPGDVAVIGFDNWDVVVDGPVPPLTSIDMDFQNLGRAAAQHLMAALRGTAPPTGVIREPCRLVIRGSTIP